MTKTQNTGGLPQAEIVEGFRRVGLKSGDVALVHSAMRTFGRIEGGAGTVVAALLEVVGPTGTLVAPAFTAVRQPEQDRIIDPRNDRSEMGAISEAVRTHPGALRSTAFRHSFAAIGRRARVITEVDPALATFDLRSAFGVMLALNTQVLLCGVTYASSTSHHFAEWVCESPYRVILPKITKVRLPNGSVISQPMTDYGSKYGTRHPDFNRLGRMLEDNGKVAITGIGNAVVRRFAMRDLIDLAQAQAALDDTVFCTEAGEAGQSTPLAFGTTVWSPERPNAVGRLNRYQWSIVDERKLKLD